MTEVLYYEANFNTEELIMKALFYIFFKLSSKFNRLKSHIRGFYYSKIFKSCGKKRPFINRQVVFSCPQNIECGSNVIINPQCYFAAKGGIILGDDVVLSAGAKILSSSLKVENGIILRRHVHKAVKLGNRVWIGAGAMVCPGVTIGENSIIAAGAVVTRDIPAYCIAAGVPAKVVRHLDHSGN